MFKVSDKVVCVDDSPGWGNNCMLGKPLPIKAGVVYVVREFRIGNEGHPSISVVGITLPSTPSGKEIFFREERFRLLSEVKAENAKKAKNLQILRNAFFSSPLNPWSDNSRQT